MKAIVQEKYGSAEVLRLGEIDKPVPGHDEVTVRVRATSVTHGDWVTTTGLPYLGRLAFGLRRPGRKVPGRDIAGEVEAIGKNVTRFQPGDEVYAEVAAGGFAEYARVSEDLLCPKPANLTFEQAAAIPWAANTALQGLRDRGGIERGQQVLINGASGGVGTFAVQIAKSFGAEVTGVCSTRNVKLVRSIGADHVVDYTREDFTKSDRRYDLIFDLAGNHSLSDCRRVLTPGGTLVLSSSKGGRWFGPVGRLLGALVLSPFVRQSVRTFMARRSQKNLADLKEMVESGQITPAIDRTYPLSEVAEAMRYFSEEHARAKIVITV
ncbi:NADPH:quinone reductase [Microtetraspora sp. NBRC 13810]|uniref:NAD(P)-dependent alcohol dehydrogenase n=1 Tax=Microtetraspora sp. NBRC 13810 TaxID=3030990 RepID=UPI0024A42835|nr:NAD(P)-dependent alcohol dehydrogenase [Microtetraspora sp. NBRC 13810]GLW07622.1 NADPH:quinone reductase [Microtetraspora sp. NBRC 13810]